MWRALVAGWILTLGYWLLRSTVLSMPDYCPDKIWESGPPECDFTVLDFALLFGVPVLLALTLGAIIWTVARRLRRRKRLPL